MQTRLAPLKIQRSRPDYPQVNYIDSKGVQHIEINRGCKRKCQFCWADPNYKVFDIPEIVRNKVQIIGENVLYDPDIENKLIDLGKRKVNNKVVYYGLGSGFDYRLTYRGLLDNSVLSRIGRINNKGNWMKGICFAWDLGLSEEHKIENVINLAVDAGYQRNVIKVFVLVNWKISYIECLYKLHKLKKWNVQIDDCTWDCTKTNFIPLYWTYNDYKDFRRRSRTHNIEIGWRGYNPKQPKHGMGRG